MSGQLESRVRAALHAELDAYIDVNFNPRVSGPWDACESPIERALAVAVCLLAGIRGYGQRVVWKGDALPESAIDGRDVLRIAPQYSIGKYRVDLLVGFSGAGGLDVGYIAVECDGHDFHEKTKEQAQRDKSRDRELSSRLARVVRFTGSEIHSDPWKCANEVIELALLLWHQQTKGGSQ